MNLILNLFVVLAYAFVPPVSVLSKDAVEGRRPLQYAELVFRHHIDTGTGETVELEEQWFQDPQRISFLFKVPGGSPIAAGGFEKRSYVFNGGAKFQTNSLLFLKYLTASNGDELLGALLNERFLRKDHLNQFKQGFEPKGDPQTWDVKEFYVQQEGVSLKRVKSQPAYCFSGSGEDLLQSVCFAKEGSGLKRLEWKKGQETWAWNFDGHTRFQAPGNFPKYFEFEKNGQKLVSSELIAYRPSKEKQITDFKKNLRSYPSPSGVYNEALKTLLSFR